MLFALNITLGYLLDLLFGDPHWFPHPVRAIGLLIERLEKWLCRFRHKLFAGAVLTVLVVASVYISMFYLVKLHWLVTAFFAYTIFATKALGNEAMKIFRLLKNNQIPEARQQIRFLVSRDTETMDEREIVRSTVETVSENVTDGITAPLFYMLLGGVPLAMAYKAASTLDSMVGYKNERYLLFGRCSARLDDVLNFIPARLTSFVLIPLAALLCGKNIRETLRIVRRDRFNHLSPNSAHSEAAFAGALGIRLGGPTSYFGKLEQKPFIGDERKPLEANDIRDTVKLMYVTSVLTFAIVLTVYLTIASLLNIEY